MRYALANLLDDFGTYEQYMGWVLDYRYGKLHICPKCGKSLGKYGVHARTLATREKTRFLSKTICCRRCHRWFSPLKDTVFGDFHSDTLALVVLVWLAAYVEVTKTDLSGYMQNTIYRGGGSVQRTAYVRIEKLKRLTHI